MDRRVWTIMVLIVLAVAACGPHRHDVPIGDGPSAPCRPHQPTTTPLAISWAEDVDAMSASIAGIAPPTLEVMADGRVVADAVRVENIGPPAAAGLRDRLRTDLGGSAGSAVPILLPATRGGYEGTYETLAVFPPGKVPVTVRVEYRSVPVPPPGSKTQSSSPPQGTAMQTSAQAQPMDQGMTGGLRDAVDALTALHAETLIHGAPYDTALVDLLFTEGQALPSVGGTGLAAASTTAKPWPTGIPTVPPYTGQGSTYGFQHIVLTQAQSAIAKSLFTEYRVGTGTPQAYSDGRAAGGLWYGTWRPLAPTEADPSIVPVVCATPALTMKPTPTPSAASRPY